jgi:hypothetical protein
MMTQVIGWLRRVFLDAWDITKLLATIAIILVVSYYSFTWLHHKLAPPPMDRATCEQKIALYLYRYGHDPSKYWECVELEDGGWAMIDRLHD